MKASELRELTLKELEERIDTEKNLLIKQKLNHAISPLDNPMKIKAARKNIARMMTVLSEKQKTEQSND
jgi:large subunit ribosomal protein L29